MVSDAFASILRSGRSDFNQRFAAARRQFPDLQPDAFSEFLETHVAEIVRAVEVIDDGSHVGQVVDIAYDVSLSLIGQKLAGPHRRLSFIDDGWRRIFPKITRLVATDAATLLPAISNALYQLDSSPGARPAEWIDAMERLGPECPDSATLLRLGQLLSWRSGLSHFREPALAIADSLPPTLTKSALNIRTDAEWSTIRGQLESSPWYDPQKSDLPAPLELMMRIGAFRGFGGLFPTPPLVRSAGDSLYVRSGDDYWLLKADIFGATLHRSSVHESEGGQSSLPDGLQVTGDSISFKGQKRTIPDLDRFTSAAVTSTTLALTSSLTYAIVLLALK
jgi:hypothetical protein